MQESMKLEFRERCARWLLLLTFLHTVPVVWLTPVAAGTAPTAALLSYGIASVLTLDHEGVALGILALVPGFIFAGIFWALAWMLGKLLQRVRPVTSACLLACISVGLLLTVYFPIYIVGGHTSSSSADLISLFDNTLSHRSLLSYWIVLHTMLAALFGGSLLREGHALTANIARWVRPVLQTSAIVVLAVVLYHNYSLFLCRPFAELGLAKAQVCVARTAGSEQRYWYERAAQQGDVEAIAWMIDKTPNRKHRLEWLRKGAEQGDPASQFGLYKFLLHTQDPDSKEEAEGWLLLAAKGDHAEAQLTLVDRISRVLYRTQSRDQLVERNGWLERADELGSRSAKLRLAQHYRDGSMGYPADIDRARAYYRELLIVEPLSEYERARQLDAATYQRQLSELDAWEAGLESRDPEITMAMAKRYLGSQFPGPGVRELGTDLMEQLAADGDETARTELIRMLRTGSGGVDKDIDAAKKWLITAAEANDIDSMERLASNYMNGREGFPIDYPKARHWTEALISIYRGSDEQDAQARVQSLQNDLRYIDRLGGYAGTAMLGSEDLEQLGKRNDAESQYEYAIQLLVGHGSKRRAEAISELHAAANMGHGGAAWRLVQVYERGFPQEIDKAAGLRLLQLAVTNHHFDATRELAISYEKGNRGLAVDLPRAIALYEGALAAGHDNRHGWNLDRENYNHYKWLESRLRQAKLKRDAQSKDSVAGR
jgi:TPR repeat protein